jgi:hypothetical protein
MAQIKVSAVERQQIDKLAKDVTADKKLQTRLLTNTNTVLKEYKLDHLMSDPNAMVVLDLHHAKPTGGGSPLTGFFGFTHIDGHGGHEDSQGHTDGPSWHIDL